MIVAVRTLEAPQGVGSHWKRFFLSLRSHYWRWDGARTLWIVNVVLFGVLYNG